AFRLFQVVVLDVLKILFEPLLDLRDSCLLVRCPLQGGDHRVSLSIRTDGGDIAVSGGLLPTRGIGDPNHGLTILANEGLSAGRCRRSRRGGRGRWGRRRCRWGGGQHLWRCCIEIRVRSILVFSARLVFGTPLSFPINGGSRGAGNCANFGTGLRSLAPPNESADHRSAHAATDRPAPA